VAVAAVVGLPMPYLPCILKRDPQVAAGPISPVASDMVTLSDYFILATPAMAQRHICCLPRFAWRIDNWPGFGCWPLASAIVVRIGPCENLLFGELWQLLPVAIAAMLRGGGSED
jgi:hypothetical protein